MKFISKLLYGFISFTVFAAYKVENAFATIKVTLATYTSATQTQCSTYTNVPTVRTTSCGKTTNFTLCEEGYYLASCTDINAATASAAMLASQCAAVTSAVCSACPNGGTVGASVRYKPKQTTITICSYHTLIDDCGVGGGSTNAIKLQTYTVTISDDEVISANFLTNCSLPSGTSVTDGTGTYSSAIACDYE